MADPKQDIGRIVERIKRVSGFVAAHPLESVRGVLAGVPSVRQVYTLEETQRPGELEMVVELFDRDPHVEAEILRAVRRALPPTIRPVVIFHD